MGQPYLGEIRMFAGGFAPAGWAMCDGQLMAKAENEALFELIGTTYGGDGQETFGLPDLRGRVPLHAGPINQLATAAGVESVTLTANQIPAHNHAVLAVGAPGNASAPSGTAVLANANVSLATAGIRPYAAPPAAAALAAQSVSSTGGSQPHDNMQPYLAINFIISLFGIFPQEP